MVFGSIHPFLIPGWEEFFTPLNSRCSVLTVVEFEKDVSVFASGLEMATASLPCLPEKSAKSKTRRKFVATKFGESHIKTITWCQNSS